MVYSKRSGKPRGYAFIEYEHERDMHCEYCASALPSDPLPLLPSLSPRRLFPPLPYLTLALSLLEPDLIGGPPRSPASAICWSLP